MLYLTKEEHRCHCCFCPYHLFTWFILLIILFSSVLLLIFITFLKSVKLANLTYSFWIRVLSFFFCFLFLSCFLSPSLSLSDFCPYKQKLAWHKQSVWRTPLLTVSLHCQSNSFQLLMLWLPWLHKRTCRAVHTSPHLSLGPIPFSFNDALLNNAGQTCY